MITMEVPDWHLSEIDRKQFRRLAKRSDGQGLRQYGTYLAILTVLGAATTALWGSWWAAVPYFFYATLYGFATSFLHECHHATPFKTRWKNEIMLHLMGFMSLKEPLRDRFMHTRHHSHTYFTGVDPEIQSERPPNLFMHVFDLTRIVHSGRFEWKAMKNAIGRMDRETLEVCPKELHREITISSRWHLAAILFFIVLAIVLQSWLPLFLTLFARFLGAWLHTAVGITQHIGMPENVTDHRLNTRTIKLNPVLQFFYCNMNYHVEHHMYPSVPFHSLPELHEVLKDDMPEPYPSVFSAWNEMVRALWRQRTDPTYSVQRELPSGREAKLGTADRVLGRERLAQS